MVPQAVCDSLSLGINSPDLLSDLSPTLFPVFSHLQLKKIGNYMGREISECFRYSSRKDQLAAFVQETLEKGVWYSRFEDPDW